MLHNIELKAILKRRFLLCSNMFAVLYNKKLCFIAHPIFQMSTQAPKPPARSGDP